MVPLSLVRILSAKKVGIAQNLNGRLPVGNVGGEIIEALFCGHGLFIFHPFPQISEAI